MPLPHSVPPRNRLLAALAPEDLNRLRPLLEPVSLHVGQVLSEPNQPIRDVYFLESGITSTVTDTGDAGYMEVGIMGREAMTAVPVIHALDHSPHEVFVQVAGVALRIRADDLRRAMDESPALRRTLLHYAQAFMVQVAQAAACNGRHFVEERLAKWLLEAHDRVEGDDLPITHFFIGLMLGVRRAGVTAALNKLEREGVIRQQRGRITVLDRSKLEEAACPCYGIVRAEFERVLG